MPGINNRSIIPLQFSHNSQFKCQALRVCEAAFEFYEKCLGGRIVMMLTYGDSPMADQTPPDGHEKIL
ncbi:MAG TPA: hypothetical protein VHS97_01020, partial [Isosphaeraceae bacterium]|nr:hypothetical protein [Isosphaeraceae bacterium]